MPDQDPASQSNINLGTRSDFRSRYLIKRLMKSLLPARRIETKVCLDCDSFTRQHDIVCLQLGAKVMR